MFKFSVVAVIVMGSVAWVSGQAAQAPDLPVGDMQAKARTACLECHESRIILQQRLNKASWGKEVDKMIKWGAVVDTKDRDALVDYLSTNFPADKPPEPAPRVPGKRK
jgi:mono/diheme cytochrome c family protein